MSDETSRSWDESAEPAKPAKPAEPAPPADEGALEPEPDTAIEPPASEPPAPSPEPPAPPASPYAPVPPQPPAQSPYEAPQQPASPYGAPAPQQPQSPYGGYAPQQPYAAAPAPGMAAPGNGKALASLVCGICAIVFSGTVIVSIVLGIVAIVLAGQYVKSFGKDGKATGGKVCGIIGIVFSVLALVSYLMLGAFTLFAIEEYASNSSYSYSEPSEAPLPLPDDSDAAAVKAAAEQVLDGLAGSDQALLARVAEMADDSFKDSTDLTLSEAGVDPLELAQWLVAGTAYDMADDDVYAYSDGTGTAFAEAQSRSFTTLNGVLYDDLTAYVEKTGGFADDAEYQAKLAELLPAAMEKAAGMTGDSYLMLDFEKTGDAWTVDDDSLEDALVQMYGLW